MCDSALTIFLLVINSPYFLPKHTLNISSLPPSLSPFSGHLLFLGDTVGGNQDLTHAKQTPQLPTLRPNVKSNVPSSMQKASTLFSLCSLQTKQGKCWNLSLGWTSTIRSGRIFAWTALSYKQYWVFHFGSVVKNLSSIFIFSQASVGTESQEMDSIAEEVLPQEDDFLAFRKQNKLNKEGCNFHHTVLH